MEMPTSQIQTCVKIPVGFRFHPTDQELVTHYLKRKVFSLPLPATVIPELDVFKIIPWDLPGDLWEKRYFFTRRRMNLNNCSNSTVVAGCGSWKTIGKCKKIVAPGNNQTIGMKKSLKFYKDNCIRTQWVMHQYSLVGSLTASLSTQKFTVPVGEWVVCCVFRRKKKTKNQVKKRVMNVEGIMGNNFELGCSQMASPSCSSGITEISWGDLDQEASTGFC